MKNSAISYFPNDTVGYVWSCASRVGTALLLTQTKSDTEPRLPPTYTHMRLLSTRTTLNNVSHKVDCKEYFTDLNCLINSLRRREHLIMM